MASLKLHYFALPGRGETVRLLFDYGKIPFEDASFGYSEWMALKPSTPFGQVPVLEVDGVMLGQSSAIDRYAAARVGLLPEDPLKAAIAEQWYFMIQDIVQAFIGTYRAQDKIAARKPILEGVMKTGLSKLDEHLEGKTYLLGDELCYVDFHIYTALSQWQSGFLDGIPTDYLKDYPNAKAFRNRMANLEFVKAKYADGSPPHYTAHQPDS